MRMFGFENGMMDSGGGWSVVRNGGDVVEWHMGALGVAGAVLGAILWALVVVALVLTIITLVRRLRNPLGNGAVHSAPMWAGTPTRAVASPEGAPVSGVEAASGQPAGVSPAALRILEDRYALGEITHEEYLERRRTLTGN